MSQKIRDIEYLYIDDIDALRRKLTQASSPLDTYWQNFQDLASSRPIGQFESYPPLAFLVTGDEKYKDSIREVFLRLNETLPLCDASLEAQFHTYTACAPIARFAVYLDWIWDSGILSDAERSELVGNMIDQVYSHAYMRLKGRLPSGDNQQVSMAYACTLLGYTFGIKRASSPAAREMFEFGVNRFYAMLGELGPGGWCGEGSVYHIHVMAPVVALYTAFMQQITGRDFFTLEKGGSTVLENLKLGCDMINCSGLLPGWDSAGNLPPQLKTHLVVYANRSGDTMPLRKIIDHGLWSENEILAWHNDDKVWTLIFWPEDVEEVVPLASERSWLNVPVAGRLFSEDRRIECFQYWDIIQAGLPGRLNVNPNCVEISSNGAVLTTDSMGKKIDKSFFKATVEDMYSPDDLVALEKSMRSWAASYGQDLSDVTPEEMRERVLQNAQGRIDGTAHCQLQAHSCIIVDDQGHRYLDEEFTGVGEDFADLPSLKAVTGDVSGFYDKLWGVDKMKRSSVIIDDELILIHDEFSSKQSHEFTFQLMLRPEVTVSGSRAKQRLLTGQGMDLACPSDQKLEVREVDGLSPFFERKTHRLSMDKTSNGDGEFNLLMRPMTCKRTVLDISKDWSRVGGGGEEPQTLWRADASVDLSSEVIAPTLPEDSVWFGKEVELDAEQVEAIERLVIPRGQFDRLDLYVNGQMAEPCFAFDLYSQGPDFWEVHKSDARFTESQFDLRSLLKVGVNRIAIASSEFRGQLISGPIVMVKLQEPEEKTLEINESDGALEIVNGQDVWNLIPYNATRQSCELSGGIRSDALRLLSGKGRLAAAHTTFLEAGDFRLEASQAVHMEKSEDALFIDFAGHDEITVRIEHEEGELQINASASITCHGTLPYPLRIRVDQSKSLFVNGELISMELDTGVVHEVAFEEAKESFELFGAYDRGWNPEAGDEELLTQLDAENWREQVAATEAIGRRGLRAAIPKLLEMFSAEEGKDIYANIAANWPFSKMKTTFHQWADDSFPEDAKRRFRLKLAIMEALGRMGAKEEGGEVILRSLEKAEDWYTANVQACVAAARLGLDEAIPHLRKLSKSDELNTSLMSALALDHLEGRLSRLEFEDRISMP